MSKTSKNLAKASIVAAALEIGLQTLRALRPDVALGAPSITIPLVVGLGLFRGLQRRAGNRPIAVASEAERGGALAFPPMPGQGWLVFIRASRSVRMLGFDVTLNGRPVTQLMTPRFVIVHAGAGLHRIFAEIPNAPGPAPILPFEMTLKDGEIVFYELKTSMGLTHTSIRFEAMPDTPALRRRLATMPMVKTDDAFYYPRGAFDNDGIEPRIKHHSKSALPLPLRDALSALGASAGRDIAPEDIEAILAQIDALPLSMITKAGNEIAELARLNFTSREDDIAALERTPDLALIFAFHRNGIVREAALDRLFNPARSAFEVVAIAYRLNDWAEPVRRAANACALRVFPLTSSDKIAAAAAFLLGRIQDWERWSYRPPQGLVDAVDRPDVIDRLITLLRTSRTGAKGRLLTDLLWFPVVNFDQHLLELSRTAFLPHVRGIALRSLIEGRARSHVRWERRWIDKPFDIFEYVPAYSFCDVDRSCDVETLIIQGARDKSIVVRRIAADGLIEHRATVSDISALARLFADDPNPSIRERMAFLARQSTLS